jgi:hypothetical protein
MMNFLFNFNKSKSNHNNTKSESMNKFQRHALKLRLLKLASLRSTGAPADLALRFDVSERSIKRLIKEMRDEGMDIRYSQSRRSYITDHEFE